MQRMKKESGFTLIEMLAVLALIAVLGMVGVPKLIEVVAKGRLEVCRANLQSIETAWDAYVGTHALDEDPTPADVNALAGLMKGGVPECPENGVYTVSDEGVAECSLHGTLKTFPNPVSED